MTKSLKPRNPNLPKFIYDPSFEGANAESTYSAEPEMDELAIEQSYMPDEVTRDVARRMHYASYRVNIARRSSEGHRWRGRYIRLRDLIVLGNRKLVYRAVRQRMEMSHRADDLVGDCHIVLIQAVAAYNPWMGIRFSTYAFTCLIRALSRLSRRIASDWLTRSLPLDSLVGSEPGQMADDPALPNSLRLDDFLRADHPLLSEREKSIIRLRFNLTDKPSGGTLKNVGRELGLSKERVRQVQAMAIGKLRGAILGGAHVE